MPQLLGFSAATGLGIYYLQQDTKEAQGLLTSSVEELTRDTQRITTHLDRLQTTEKDLTALRKDAVTKDELVKLRAELKKAYVSREKELWIVGHNSGLPCQVGPSSCGRSVDHLRAIDAWAALVRR